MESKLFANLTDADVKMEQNRTSNPCNTENKNCNLVILIKINI